MADKCRTCFNSRPRMEGDLENSPVSTTFLSFQFTPSHGGRRTTAQGEKYKLMFQFTPSHGGRLSALWKAWCGHKFQFTPSHGGRLYTYDEEGHLIMFQFTPSHGGRPRCHAPLIAHVDVSIHALAWRATNFNSQGGLFAKVSIHALAWRATLNTGRKGIVRLFQFTPSHGGRPELISRSIKLLCVSIHALAWRATALKIKCPQTQYVSIHALAWRATD